MEISGIGGKRYFCHSCVVWVKAEALPEAFSPLWQSLLHFPSTLLFLSRSLSFLPFCPLHFTFIGAPSFKTLHLWVQFYGLVHNLPLYLSFFFCGDTNHLPHFLYPCIFLFKASSSWHKKTACVHSFFFYPPSSSAGPSRWRSLPPPALLQCLFKHFHSHCTLSLTVSNQQPSPLPPSLMDTFCICASLCSSFFFKSILVHFFFFFIPPSFHSSSWCSLLLWTFSEIQRRLHSPPLFLELLNLRGDSGRKVSQSRIGIGKKKYIFTLTLSHRHVIVK